ncbi:hypothetical protein ACIBI3_21470 [Actinomadura luteofluorescens]|uniref:hypothetical protein n=1 Tax=Actinomadura luteofluorescens TaxID=46163 RepID=UPI003495239E
MQHRQDRPGRSLLATVADLPDEDFARPSGSAGWLVAGPGVDALPVGTGRRVPTAAERADLGDLAAQVPFILG